MFETHSVNNMKLLAFLVVAVVALQVSAVPTDTDLGTAIKHFLNKLKISMPCGFGDGKSLNPYVITKNDGESHTVQYNAPDIQFKLKIKDFKVDGLNSYEVLSSEYNKDTKEYVLDFKTPKSNLEAEYEIDNKVNVTYLGMKLTSKGKLELDVKDARIKALFIFDNDSEGNLKVRTLNFTEPESQQKQKFNYGEEVDEAFSELSEMFDEIDSEINEAIAETVLPKLNEMLKRFKTVDELTETIIKMTGDDQSGLFGKGEACNKI